MIGCIVLPLSKSERIHPIIQSTRDRSLLERGKTIHPIIQSTRDRSLLERGKTIHPIIQSTHDRERSCVLCMIGCIVLPLSKSERSRVLVKQYSLAYRVHVIVHS
jgi:hypothetical protein